MQESTVLTKNSFILKDTNQEQVNRSDAWGVAGGRLGAEVQHSRQEHHPPSKSTCLPARKLLKSCHSRVGIKFPLHGRG